MSPGALDESASSSSAPPPTVRISPVSLRTLTGPCPLPPSSASSSRSSLVDWSPCSGLIAHASNCLIVVVDPVTMQVVQVLDRHRAAVTRLCWTRTPTAKHPADRLTLASADAAGNVVIWNVKSGEVKSVLQEGKSSVAHMEWLDGRYENTGHLLAALHPPFSFVLWDTASGEKVWKKTYTETLQGFDFDPFDASRIAFRCLECVLFVNDFSPFRAPTSSGKKFYILGPASSTLAEQTSPSRGQTQQQQQQPTPSAVDVVTPLDADKTKATRTKIKRFMKDFVLSPSATTAASLQALAGGNNPLTLSGCSQVLYHRSAKNHLLLVYAREVLVLDLDIGQTVGIVAQDRSSPQILSVYPSRQRDALFMLNECGALSMRSRRGLYTVAATPAFDLKRSFSTASVGSVENHDGPSDAGSGSLMEIAYDTRAYSESVRLPKNARILGMAANPVTESNFAIVTTDGRMVFVDAVSQDDACSDSPLDTLDRLLPPTLSPSRPPQSQPLKLLTSGILGGLLSPPFVLRMCPALTMKNMSEYRPLMAVGGQSGNIQICNMSTGRVEREFAVHTFPVGGIEWTGLHTLLSHAHQPLSGQVAAAGSAVVRNELVLTDIRTGRTTSLRQHRSEEPPIVMLRVSHLKQYFIVAFAGAPFELWDLRAMTLLRTMPKKFPPITALDWSPLHNLKSLKRRINAMQEEKKEGAASPDHEDKENAKPSAQSLVAKEHFVFTDPEGQLYHFSVEGNTIKDGTKVPAEASLATISCIAWKSDHIVRGDSDGNLNVWDVRTRTARNVATNRGAVKKIRFAPGRGNLKILLLNVAGDAVSIWDVKEDLELVNELRIPKDMTSKVVDIDWAASDRAVLATADGSLRIVGLGLSACTAAMADYCLDEAAACHHLLPNKARNNLRNLLSHQPWKGENNFSLDFTADDGFSTSEVEFVKEQIALLPMGSKEFMESVNVTTAERCLFASRLTGLTWESEFWQVAGALLGKTSTLDTCFDTIRDDDTYRRHEREKLALHETRAANRDSVKKVVDQMLCLGENETAVRLLLESATDPEASSYIEDCLRACLVSSASVSERGSPHSTIKLVATNLIAEGKLWEGVQLLCLIDKVYDACKYLQSHGQWDASLWLAKCRLAYQTVAADGDSSNKEFREIVSKYAESCLSRELKKRAVLVYLSLGDVVGCIDALVSAKMISLAAQFMQAAEEQKLLPDTSHSMVLREEVSLAYARHLFDCGNVKAAFFYCDKADEKGEMLRREMEVLVSAPGQPPEQQGPPEDK